MDQPKDMPDDVFEIVEACWCNEPQDRLTAAEAAEKLEELSPDSVEGYIDLNSLQESRDEIGRGDSFYAKTPGESGAATPELNYGNVSDPEDVSEREIDSSSASSSSPSSAATSSSDEASQEDDRSPSSSSS
jgi:hypothetical protein